VSPFTRDEHLTDLGLELFDADELEADEARAVSAHLEACERCAARHAAFADTPAVGPPPQQLRPGAANRPTAWRWLAPVVAVAAVALAVLAGTLSGPGVGVPDGEQSDGIRLKGRGLSLQVVRDQADGAEVVPPGGTIHPGDRLGFVVGSRTAGELMIVAVDPQGRVDPCHPSAGVSSAPLEAGPARPLDSAVRTDDILGAARFVALRCDEGFGVQTAREVAFGADPPPGCVVEEVVLDKVLP